MQAIDPQQLAPLKIDVAQWRRDIQTFVVSTQRELQAVRDELSGGFGGAASRPTPPANPRRAAHSSGTPADTLAGPAAMGTAASGARSAPSGSSPRGTAMTSELPPHDRLALLKQKLAAQVASGGTAPAAGKLAPPAERVQP